MKLNVLLAKTDHLAAPFKNNIKDFIKFFKNNQGSFKGEKKTYAPREGVIDDPTKRGTTRIVSTVGEKITWFEENQAEYINSLFSQERTNALGNAKAELIVDGQSWGELTTLELLRLKSLVEAQELKEMYESIPVRSDAEVWNNSDNEDYSGRAGIFQTDLLRGVAKTTTKETYVLEDPNVQRLTGATAAAYKATTATRDTVVELGDYTVQKFSGEYSHRQRAEILKRRGVLLTAVIEALKRANEVDAVESQLTAERIFNYLHSR